MFSAAKSAVSLVWIQSTFKPKPLPADVRLDGQTAIITGSNVGLGFEAAKELAAHGLSRLVLGVRSVPKGEEARAAIARESPGCAVEVWQLDQESWESMAAFARRARALDRLDILCLNAGLKRLEYGRSPTGHEAHVQVNHLGTALLSLLLLAPLRRTAALTGRPARMTVTASSVAFDAPVGEVQKANIIRWLDDPASFKTTSDTRYWVSKLLDVLWARALAEHVDGKEVLVNMLNPGLCQSEFHRVDPTAAKASKYIAWTSAQGAWHITDAATGHLDSHGEYLSEQRIRPVSKFVTSAEGKAAQRKLWDETLALFRAECPSAELEEFKDW